MTGMTPDPLARQADVSTPVPLRRQKSTHFLWFPTDPHSEADLIENAVAHRFHFLTFLFPFALTHVVMRRRRTSRATTSLFQTCLFV